MKPLCMAILLAGVASAQTIGDTNAHAWFMYFGDHAVSQRWGVHLEGQWRRADIGTEWQQLLLRPGVNYQLRPNLMLTAGYGYVRTHPYGDFPSAARFPEHRTYEQVLWTQRAGRIPIQHRLRLEQRWVGQTQGGPIASWQYRNRFRYMLRGDIPLRGRTYLGLYDELFLAFGRNRGPQSVDQNRAYGALGYNLGKPGRIEVGYMHQYVPQRNGIVKEHNHTLQVAFYSKLPFTRGKQR